MHRAPLAFAALLGLNAWAAAPAEASLIGQKLDVSYYLPDTGTIYGPASFSPSSFTVAPGLDTVGNVEGVTALNVSFQPRQLSIRFDTSLTNPTWNPVAFNGPIFTAAGPLGIASASVDPATTMAGFDASRVSFTDNRILLNWQGLSYRTGTVVAVDFDFVPEPASFLLLGSGLLGVAMLRRQQAPART